MLEISTLEQTIESRATKRRYGVLSNKEAISKICDIVGDALRTKGPMELHDIGKCLIRDGFNLSYSQIDKVLNSSFKYKNYKELAERYGTRLPYAKHSTSRVWYMDGQDKALEYYIRRIAHTTKV